MVKEMYSTEQGSQWQRRMVREKRTCFEGRIDRHGLRERRTPGGRTPRGFFLKKSINEMGIRSSKCEWRKEGGEGGNPFLPYGVHNSLLEHVH
jgi:hypothetical protein